MKIEYILVSEIKNILNFKHLNIYKKNISDVKNNDKFFGLTSYRNIRLNFDRP